MTYWHSHEAFGVNKMPQMMLDGYSWSVPFSKCLYVAQGLKLSMMIADPDTYSVSLNPIGLYSRSVLLVR
jgi:hypothetical protein